MTLKLPGWWQECNHPSCQSSGKLISIGSVSAALMCACCCYQIMQNSVKRSTHAPLTGDGASIDGGGACRNLWVHDGVEFDVNANFLSDKVPFWYPHWTAYFLHDTK